jgi:hypothetical protein
MLSEYFARRPEVPPALAQRVMSYYHQLWDQFGGSEEEDIIKEWPQPLKEQVSFFF